MNYEINIDFLTVKMAARIFAWYKRRRGYTTQITNYEREPPTIRGFETGYCVRSIKVKQRQRRTETNDYTY